MKLTKYAAGVIALVAAFSMGGCSSGTDKISNNLSGATRENSTYDYNNDNGSNTDGTTRDTLGFPSSRGAGYWDYYGITDGYTNDNQGFGWFGNNNYGTSGTYARPNTVTDGTYSGLGTNGNGNYGASSVYGTSAYDTQTIADTANVDSAVIAD